MILNCKLIEHVLLYPFLFTDDSSINSVRLINPESSTKKIRLISVRISPAFHIAKIEHLCYDILDLFVKNLQAH